MEKPFTLDFDDIGNILGSHFFGDPKSKENIEQSSFSESQIKIINTLMLPYQIASYVLQYFP